ncbi:DUF2306 domain-containing protein [Tateyamaria omphalii]|uniref:DUF2306 domain-containing protein n=1 Tax=Tateyamaria omphalii TaxID=299262 RepID=UPI001C99DEB0|nr:DUF2306 domain-containing protein [Tateyamaria omphalii]MBY5932517.1 DUF2306 domain-containing protein [Tateyamaria omphalii]
MASSTARTRWSIAGLVLLFVLVLGFVWHSAQRGMLGLSGDTSAIERLTGPQFSLAALFAHMVTGAVVTLLSVVQLAAPIRQRWPRVHRVSGRVLAGLAFITGVGGLIYIALSGTVGGLPMSIAFGLYGTLMIIAAIQTPRFAMARDYARHRRWGLRLIVLGLGSWLYRLHYGLWYGTTCSLSDSLCGIAAEPDFSGLFDQINLFAFYLPYILVLEWWLRREQRVQGDHTPYASS